MGTWIRCNKCGGKVRKLKVMEAESPSMEEAVAQTLMGIECKRVYALQCIDEKCGEIVMMRVNRKKAKVR